MKSGLRLAMVDYLSELRNELVILLVFPCFVGLFNAILHLLERLLEHGREIAVHRFDVKLKFSKLLFLRVFRLLNLSLNFLFLLL